MSSDQRPARTVIIAPDAPAPLPPVGDPGAGVPPPTMAPAPSHVLLLSALFLFACVAGAVGVALAPWLTSGR